MIGRLRGIHVSSQDTDITIDVNGVGYEVQVTPRDLGSLPGLGEEIVVHTHTHVRDVDLSLYGFASESDRDLFRILLTASGVGPKLAMAILGSIASEEVIRAIVSEDPDTLTLAPGVGKRGAQKIVLELAPKLAGREIEMTRGGELGSVRQALESLGYTTAEINTVISSVDPNDPLDVQIKAALQSLGSQ
ncbi:MAG: Holliday junction branch migration protein RuvA [Actinobacteria bacterium]|nr:Holliday junction branch migration protein RuvA [Actinomycetota bacterium]